MLKINPTKKKMVGHIIHLPVKEENKISIRQACREKIRKTKAHIEKQLARDIKNNKRAFCDYVKSMRLRKV